MFRSRVQRQDELKVEYSLACCFGIASVYSDTPSRIDYHIMYLIEILLKTEAVEYAHDYPHAVGAWSSLGPRTQRCARRRLLPSHADVMMSTKIYFSQVTEYRIE